MADRSVLALEGGTAGALDFRFKMNAVLRAGPTTTSKIAVLRRSQKGVLSFRGTDIVPCRELEKLSEDLETSQREISRRAPSLYRRLGKDTPLRYRSGAVEEEGADFDDGFRQMDQMVTSADKKSLAYISAVQLIEKTLAADEERWHKAVVTRSLIERTLTNAAMTMEARTSNAYRESGVTPGSSTVVPPMVTKHLKGAPLPKIHEAVVGIEVQYSSTRDILPDDYEHLASFLMRNKDASRWFAPHDARDSSGRILPMPHDIVNRCIKNLTLKEAKVAAIPKEVKEALAWKWLIISHNHVVRTKEERVFLPTKLNLSYSRKVERRREPRAPGPSAESVRKLLAETVEDLRKSFVESRENPEPAVDMVPTKEVLSFLQVLHAAISSQLEVGCDWNGEASRFSPKLGKENYATSATRWNKVLAAGEDLLAHRAVELPEPEDFPVLDIDRKTDEFLSSLPKPAPAVSSPAPTPDQSGQGPAYDGTDFLAGQAEAKAAEDQPIDDEVLSDDEGWEERHPEFIVVNDQTFFRNDIQILDVMEGQELRTVFHNDLQYYCVVGEPTGPAKSSKKGKIATRPVPDPSPKGKEKKGVKGKEEKGESSKVPPVAQENPLRVKGEPKSKALSNEQRVALRKYFKLKDTPVAPEVWSSLTSKEKSAAMAERSIPRWASDAVLKSASNLQQIVEGKLTKDNAMTAARDPKKLVANKATGQALEAWQSLKADFKGTSLFKTPHTAKEKAFKKRFDQLLADYGQQPCFPKLRERPDHQGRSSSRGRKPASTDLSGMIEMARAFGQIASALRGGGSG